MPSIQLMCECAADLGSQIQRPVLQIDRQWIQSISRRRIHSGRTDADDGMIQRGNGGFRVCAILISVNSTLQSTDKRQLGNYPSSAPGVSLSRNFDDADANIS